jgi:DNA excision repair protein ERCC-2
MDIRDDYCFIIDEAHNLVDRSREMYSSKLNKKSLLDLKRETKNKDKIIYKSLKEINDYLIKLRKECQDSGKEYIVREKPEAELYPLLRNFTSACDEYLGSNHQSPFVAELLDIYFEVMAFLKISEYYDEKYVTLIERFGNDISIKLFCVDPSYVMGNALKRCRSAVFFSATLSPMDYFIRTFGGDEKCLRLRLPSPYPSENLCLLIDNRTSTMYKMRELTYDRVAELIHSAAGGRIGNYLVYFPSYKYMNEVYTKYCESNPEVVTICQKPGMTDEEREEFLACFSSSNTSSLVGFAVMGGVFGEGIDLVGDRLSGAVIVGVGLPQVGSLLLNGFPSLGSLTS